MDKLSVNFEPLEIQFIFLCKINIFSDYTKLLPEIDFMLNITVQSTTKLSPIMIVFGKNISKEWCEIDHEEYDSDDNYINKRNIKRIENHENVKANIENLKFDDKKYIKREFELSDIVLVRKSIRNKDDDRFEGPGVLIDKEHDRSYSIRFENGRTLVRNIEWLKPS